MKYYCTVTLESDYVIEADSAEEAYETAWSQAYSAGADVAIVDVEVSKIVYQ